MRNKGLLFAILLASMPLASIRAADQGTNAQSSSTVTANAAEGVGAKEDDTPDVDDKRLTELLQAHRASMISELSASSDPRDWAVADLLESASRVGSHAQEGQDGTLLQRAAAAAPDDTLVLWTAMLQRRAAGAKADDILTRLENLEPDNAAVWIEALTRAWQRNDRDASDAALARMATSTRDDDHFSDLIKAQLDAYRRYPLPDEFVRLSARKYPQSSVTAIPFVYTMATTAAFALPAYQSLTRACTIDESNEENASRAGACAAIGRLLATQGTTLIANRIGASVLRLSRTFNDDDVERSRQQDWLMKQRSDLLSVERADENVEASLRDWVDTRSEIESYRRAVARAGKPLIPPMDWVDERSPFSAERLHQDRVRSAQGKKAS